MTAIDKQAAIAALKADLDELRVAVTSHGTGYDRKPVAIASALGNARRLIAALEADDGRALLRQLRDDIARRDATNRQNFAAGISPCKDPAVLEGCSIANADAIEMIDDILAAEPAQSTEPAAPAGDDEARIEALPTVESVDEDLHSMIDEGTCDAMGITRTLRRVLDERDDLMREFLARAVKAEAEVERLRGRDAEPFDWDAAPDVQEWIDENLPEREPRAGSKMVELHADEVVADRGEARRVAGWLKDIMAENADLRAKLAAAEKERDAAVAALDRLLRSACRLLLADQHVNGITKTAVRDLRSNCDATREFLRYSPPSAPAGEAPAPGAGDDVLREFMEWTNGRLCKRDILEQTVAELCRRELARGDHHV